MIRRAIVRAGGLAAVLTGLAGAGAWQLLRRPLPQEEGRLALQGLEGEVEVRRDRHGVPHIDARSRHDLWFAQGVVHAQDRLFQMELGRRVSSGRLSEVVGSSGLENDRLMRTLGLRRVAEREAEALDADFRDQLEAYCLGVGEGVRSLGALPIELQVLRIDPEPWRPVDMLCLSKVLSLGLSTNWERELLRADLARELGAELAARLDPTYPAGAPVADAPGARFPGEASSLVEQAMRVRDAIGLPADATGSNNWAVDGSRTRTGRPLFAGDPHLPASIPAVWHVAGLRLGERFARGATLPGFPGLFMGQNPDVCWSFTNLMADVMDLFVERIEGDRYRFGDELREVTSHEETIAVRGRSRPETLHVRETHHGPLVGGVLGTDEALALAWTGLRMPAYDRAPVSVLEPTSGTELEELMSRHGLPVLSMVWADREGIGFRAVGSVPVREGGSPDLPRPGWTGTHEWVGSVPYDELPSVRDPEAGYVVTANNRVCGVDYPHHLTSEWLDGHRARRIVELLDAEETHDVGTFSRIQRDVLSHHGLETARRLARLSPPDQRAVRAIEELRSWDGRMDPDSVAATIYQAFTLRLGRELCRAVIRDRDLSTRWLDRSPSGFLGFVTSPWRWQPHLLALWKEADDELIGRPWDDLALDALRGALDDLEDRYGPDHSGWRWGRVHETRLAHPLGGAHPVLDRALSRSLPAGGAQETVQQVGWDPNAPFAGAWAPTLRLICDPGDPAASVWQMAPGNSGHPSSPHYSDLVGRWLDGGMQPLAGEGPWRRLVLAPAHA